MLSFDSLLRELASLLEGESDLVANAANFSAYVYEQVPNINWVGFYFLKDQALVVGPFQGRVACTRIPIGKGVCGTAFKEQRVMNVPDVHEFAGHIACDTASKSELVVPLGSLGVLDIDSAEPRRFDAELEQFFIRAAELFLSHSTR